MRKIVIFGLFLILFIACKNDEQKIDVSNINVQLEIARFDVDFYNTTKETLPQTKEKYPLLFPAQTHDSVWVRKINDKDEQELFSETQKVFANFSSVKKQLQTLFKHIKYYNPKFKTPKIITVLSDIDYDSRAIYADSLLLISLDGYLGKKHEFYTGHPNYIRLNNHKNHIQVDVASAIIDKQIFPTRKRDFISKMIHEGKKMYLLDAYLPTVSEQEKFGVSQKKMKWAFENEEQIWKYFIDKKYLYSTNSELNKRFLEIAPYSKFYLEGDNLSPGRVGVYIGWQIVRAYMKNNDVSLQELIKANEETIFKEAKYKPKR